MFDCMLKVLCDRYDLCGYTSYSLGFIYDDLRLNEKIPKEIIKYVLDYLKESNCYCVDEFGYQYLFSKTYKDLDKDTKKMLKNCIKTHLNKN